MQAVNLMQLDNKQIMEIQNGFLRKQLDLLNNSSPYYKKLFRKNGIDISKIRSVTDLKNIPVTKKEEYVNNPEAFKLVHEKPNIYDSIWQVMYTAGTTTGKPSPFYWTTYDYYASLVQAKRSAEIDGLCKKDLAINLCPLTALPHAAYHRSLDSCIVAGVPLVAALTGSKFDQFPVHNNSETALNMIEEYMATVLMGMPSFIRRLLLIAVEEKRKLPNIRLIRIFGEACHKGMRKNMHELLEKIGCRDVKIVNCLGSTETSGSLAIECNEFCGMHCSSPDFYFVEILDKKSYEPIPEGEVGLLCITHLNRRGSALLRFILGDMVSVTSEPCAYCGRKGVRIIGEPYRVSEIVKIRGTLINPDTLKSIITSIEGIGEYKIIYSKENMNDPFSMDILKLQISIKGNRSEIEIVDELKRRVKNDVEVSPVVEIKDENDIYDPKMSIKAQRIIDERCDKGEGFK